MRRRRLRSHAGEDRGETPETTGATPDMVEELAGEKRNEEDWTDIRFNLVLAFWFSFLNHFNL